MRSSINFLTCICPMLFVPDNDAGVESDAGADEDAGSAFF